MSDKKPVAKKAPAAKKAVAKKSIEIRSADNKHLAGRVSIAGKNDTPTVAEVSVSQSVEATPKTLDGSTFILKLIKADALPESLVDSFPNGIDKTAMAKVYEDVAKSMLENKEYPLEEYEVPEDLLPDWKDSKGIREFYRELNLDDCRQIEDLVDDAGESLKDMDETKLAWIRMTYDWAYNALMGYLGSHSYVTERGIWGVWVPNEELPLIQAGSKVYAKKFDFDKERQGWA